MDVSDRRMQVQLTPEAKIASDFFHRSNFCGCGLCQRSVSDIRLTAGRCAPVFVMIPTLPRPVKPGGEALDIFCRRAYNCTY